MTSAVFYGRVSGDEQQDPESSIRWQQKLAAGIADSQGLTIIREYFDEDSRQIAWKLRPAAKQLLEDLIRPNRDFDAIIVAEQARAFYGTQAAHVLPLFRHHNVAYYSPEFPTGYRHDDPGDQISISVQGTLAESEIRRTRIRVTTTMHTQTESEGRFLGGRPPYGYDLVDAGDHPTRAKARAGQRLHKLALNNQTAPVVRRIFDEFLAGSGYGKITQGLTRDGIPSPSASDPDRNKHRLGSNGAWAKSAVRAILTNPKYTGHQVWKRTAGSEQLRDPHDVSLGSYKHMNHLAATEWVWSREPSHDAIITMDEHRAVHDRLGRTTTSHATKRSKHPYKARGIVRCGLCNRKLASHWHSGRAHYRCVYAETYALPTDVNHPKTVYLREDSFLPQLGAWLATMFDPETIDDTCELLATAHAATPGEHDARRADAERQLDSAQKKIRKCEALLLDDADPKTVAQWLNAAVATRDDAAQVLAETADVPRLTAEDFKRLIGTLPDLSAVFTTGNAEDVQQVLTGLGVELVYHPTEQKLVASAGLGWCASDGVEGGT